MKILIIGGCGAGTTVAFNICRELFIEAGAPFTSRGASGDTISTEALLLQPGNQVLKSHDALIESDDRLTRVILCKRNLYDAAASIYRRRPEEDVLLNTIRMRRTVDKFYEGRRRVLQIQYERYWGAHRRKCEAIAYFIGFPLRHGQIQYVADRTSVAATKRIQSTIQEACPDTEIRPDHIGPCNGEPGAGKKLPVRLRTLIAAIYKGPDP